MMAGHEPGARCTHSDVRDGLELERVDLARSEAGVPGRASLV